MKKTSLLGKRAKKLLALLAVLALCVSIVGCTGNSDDKLPSGPVSGPSTEVESDSEPVKEVEESSVPQESEPVVESEPEKESETVVESESTSESVVESEPEKEPEVEAEPEAETPVAQGTEGSVFVFAGGENIKYESADLAWFTNAKDEDIITVVYTCTDATHANWGIMKWGASINGVWTEGNEIFADATDPTVSTQLNISVKDFKAMFGIKPGDEVSLIQLGAWNGGKIEAFYVSAPDAAPKSLEEAKEVDESLVTTVDASKENLEPLTGDYIYKFTELETYRLYLYDLCKNFIPGRTITVNIEMESNKDFGGCLGTCVANWAWQMEEFKSGDTNTATATWVLTPSLDYIDLQMWWMSGTEIGIKSIDIVTNVDWDQKANEAYEAQKAEELANNKFDEYTFTLGATTDDVKEKFAFDLYNYFSDLQVGDKVNVTATFSGASTSYGGCLGVATADGWHQETFDNSTGTVSYEVEVTDEASQTGELQMWWLADCDMTAKLHFQRTKAPAADAVPTGPVFEGQSVTFSDGSWWTEVEIPYDTFFGSVDPATVNKITVVSDTNFVVGYVNNTGDGTVSDDPYWSQFDGAKKYELTNVNLSATEDANEKKFAFKVCLSKGDNVRYTIRWYFNEEGDNVQAPTYIWKTEKTEAGSGGNATINIADYCADYQNGDTVTITAKMTSTADYFNGCIGANVAPETWGASAQKESGAGQVTWTHETVVADGTAQIQIWWMNPGTITLDSVEITKAGGSTGGEAGGETGGETDPEPIWETTVTEGGAGGNATLTVSDYCDEYQNGDTVNITVKMTSTTDYFNGCIGANDGTEFVKSETKESTAAGEVTWTHECVIADGGFQIQIWWMNPGTITIDSVEITKAGGSTGGEVGGETGGDVSGGDAAPAAPTGSVTFSDSAWWTEKALTRDQVLCGVDPSEIASITISSTTDFQIGYNNTTNDSPGDAPHWTQLSGQTSYTMANVDTSSNFGMNLGLSKGDGVDYTFTWTINKK